MKPIFLAATTSLAMTPISANAQTSDATSQPTTLEVRDVGAIEGVETTLMVPENRQDPSSRKIAVRFVTLPALKPSGAAPVVYLAGGPGGSATGTARSPRWPLFDALRQTRDVILLDQRGTGRSDAPPNCATSIGWTPEDVGDRETFVAKQQAAFKQCEAFWIEAGVDLRGYTTAESAADIRSVSEAVGSKVSLLGISYGTHLALATLKAHADVIDRAVLVSVEGLDQTVKLPARTEAYFARLQAALDESALAAGREPYPDLNEALRKALARVERDKPQIDVMVARGRPPVKRTLGPFAVQAAVAFSLADPRRAHDVARGVLGMAADEPDYRLMRIAGRLMPEQIRMRAMATVMDLASGVSDERMALIEEQAETALFGDVTNFPMPHLNEQGAPYRLPASFRSDPVAGTPTLVISGTLDGRTYPASGQEATAGLTNRTTITVENAGHNLFFDHSEVVPSVVRFLDAQDVEATT
ncbi:MAG: alpha/beta fold hydrolase, partial [Erythrobacter sp.]|nr:alpha/beta fold hydrolase [Erythrobacter sp.]